jgi:hypothetical protein
LHARPDLLTNPNSVPSTRETRMSDWIPGEVVLAFSEHWNESTHDKIQADRSHVHSQEVIDNAHAVIDTLTADLARVKAERDSAIREWGRASGERDNAADSYVFLMRVIEAIEEGSVMVAALTGEKNRWVGWRDGNPTHFATAGEAYRWSDEIDPEGGPDCTTDPTS